MVLDQYEIEELEHTLYEIENIFHFKFEDEELNNLKTLGDLFDLTKEKINLQNINDCSSQQAFYKFRHAVLTTKNIDRNNILTTTKLQEIFPRNERKESIKQIENNIGFDLNLLVPPQFIVDLLFITLFTSLIGLFFIWQYALPSFVLSILSLWLAFKLGNELDVNTVGELAQKMVKENYLNSRRDPNSFNKNEIDNLITAWLSEVIEIEKVKRNTRFY